MVNKAYEFCAKSINLKTTPKYVKKQMLDFMDICDGKSVKYTINDDKVNQLVSILQLLVMPKGLKAGQTLYECTLGYQWLFYIAVLCVVHRDNPSKRRYECGVLEICRKNFKTYTIATIFIILFLTEPQFSRFFSVAPDGSLSREIKNAIAETLMFSPKIYDFNGTHRFKILRDSITFKPFQTEYTPLAFSTSRMDGRLPNAFIADEVGALPTSYPINAMRSGQLNILNKLSFIISTKYPTSSANPFEDEVSYSKKVLDGIVDDDTRFSLLYEPDITKGWETNDLILKQSNPVALEIPEIWEDLLKKRSYAIAVESARENFVTKHCNIICTGGGESYIDVKAVQDCKIANIDWNDRVVYLGLDLSISNDNTSVSMVAVDENNRILADSFAFVPAGKIEEKTARERVSYREFIRTGKVIPCGDKAIDYLAVEEFILSLEEKYGVHIQGIAYDRMNCMSTAQKLSAAGYNVVEVKQHSSTLHSPTKLLKEKILNGEFSYTENKLLEINFQNAKCLYDTNKNQYVAKKKSNGKVDMVVSLINAMYLLEQDCFLNRSDFIIQTI